MRRLRNRLGLALPLVVAVVATACASGNSQPASERASGKAIGSRDGAETVKVGVLAIRAGAGAQVGQMGERATRWWADRVNAAGGILGRPVQLVVEEEAAPQDTVARFRKLVLQDGVEVVLGVTSTASGLALAPVAEQMGVPLLMWDGTTQNGVDETMPDPEWVFRSTDNETEAIGAALLTARHFKDVRKVAGINNDYSYGRDNWVTYQAVLKKLLPQVTFTEGIFTKVGETDFSTQIAALSASGADLLMSSFWSNDAPVFLKQATAVGLFEHMRGVFTTAGGVVDALKKEITPEGLLLGYNSMYFDTPGGSELLAGFVRDYHAEHGAYPASEADHAYFVAEAWRAAVERAAGTKQAWPRRRTVVDALEGIEVESLSGPRRMRKDHVAEARFFQGIATHDNPYDFATIAPVEVLPTERIMKPTASTRLFDWIGSWPLAPDGPSAAAQRDPTGTGQ
jgi:branched-chain amino acid transport system substrate-binding protein